MVITSVVLCKDGYQAVAQYDKPVNFCPHFKTVVVRAKGKTIEEAVEKAKTL